MSGKSASHSTARSKTPGTITARTSPAKAADATVLQPPTKDGVPDAEAVRARAYALWTQAGQPAGDGVEYWLRAEQELSHRGD